MQPILSRDGGIGRHEGLKILWPVMAVRVQVPLAVLKEKAQRHISLLICVFEIFSFASAAQDLRRKSRGTKRKRVLNMEMLGTFC